ncbi:triacylglycerol lipase [Rhodococcus sp. WMMA185]|uniref:lipase family protein n=1 Tax=Rhodococcus sp. WMMA185 TaxID=679318 RepID=UPI0008786EAE|nr:lipase family protein [Rhodococcus sp. WMMA185]AOW93131.1 triacylglycerol lipase [Rhodococcus sp. WMMA185]
MRLFRSVVLLTVSTCAAALVSVYPLHSFARPLGPGSISPTPIQDDDFFLWPPNVEEYEPGEIIRSREVALRSFPNTLVDNRAFQIMVRSNDSKDRPVPVTATLLVPTASWTAPGPRPVIAYNMPIDSLGAHCTPSYRMLHDWQNLDIDIPPVLSLFLSKNYAVLVTDHQGPRMAYSAGRMAGHAVLDSIRGMKRLTELGLSDSPVVATGYSGGAIATGWAAQLQPSYAPDAELVGVAAGGTPADFGLLRKTLNGQIGSGLYLAAVLGLAREYPEMLVLTNPLGVLLATSMLKDQCSLTIAPAGIASLPAEVIAATPDPFNSPTARAVVAENRMGALVPSAPVLLYHGSSRVFLGDEWIPEEGVIALQQEWCRGGADVTYSPQFGEHITAAVLALPEVVHWMDERLAGVAVAPGCH